jgi:hypothetical protein
MEKLREESYECKRKKEKPWTLEYLNPPIHLKPGVVLGWIASTNAWVGNFSLNLIFALKFLKGECKRMKKNVTLLDSWTRSYNAC